MFNMKKSLLKKFSYSFLGLFLVFNSCQVEEDSIQNSSLNNKLPYLTSKVNYKKIEKNSLLLNKLNNIDAVNNNNIGTASSKIIFVPQYDFYIDTDESNYIESINGDYHSYTFPIVYTTEQDSTSIKNLVLSFNVNKNDYDANIIAYSVNQIEKLKIKNNEFVDLTGKSSMVTLSDFNTGEIINSLMIVLDLANASVSCWDNISGTSSSTGCDRQVIGYTQVPCDFSVNGEGGSSNTNNSGSNFPHNNSGNNSNNTGNNGGYNNGSSTNTPHSGGSGSVINNTPVVTSPILKEFISQEQIFREKCFMSSTNSNGLTFNQRIFLNSNSNQTIKAEILKYLESQVTDQTATCPNQDAFNYVKQIINDLMNNECVILPKFLDPTQVTAPYDPNIFGDYPAPTVQQDHDAIQQQFNNLRNTSGNLAAVNYLISTYNMNTFGSNSINLNYTISFENGLSNGADANAIRTFTSGTLTSCNLEIDINLFSSVDFGYITRVIKHELLHILQGITYGQYGVSVAAQEFDAYYLQIFGFKELKAISNASIQYQLAKKMITYMKQLTSSEKLESKKQIDKVKLTFPELCKD